VAFGLNERQVLWALYGVAALSGVLAIMIESSSYSLSLILVPILVITFALVTAYLGGIKIATSKTVDLDEELTNAHQENPASTIASPFVRVIVNLTFKRHLFEVLLDFVIMILAFYLAFVALYGITLSEQHWLLFINALPSVVAMTYISFFAMGVYRGVWRYVSSNDFIRYTKAAALSMILAGLSIYLIYTVRAAPTNPPANVAYSPVLFLFFGILLFLGLAATRSSFKLMDVFFNQQLRIADEKVLIFGATDSGEMAARWILMNPQFKFKPVGFIDEDPLKIGRNIHGIEVLGSTEQLRTILIRQKIDGMIFTAPIQPQSNAARARDTALGLGCWIRQFRLEFEVIE
jgi:UDP-GlcNAc:undecaprenyl-phosphate GlcNAc-1-phosphate transferase